MKTRSSLTMVPAIWVALLFFQGSARATPSILNTLDVNLPSGSTLTVEIDGPIVGTQYSQLNVTGTVTLNDANLDLLIGAGFTPVAGTMFTIINNDLSDPIMGTFHNLPQGTIFSASGDFFQISYQGGNGNDVVLTAEAPSGVPDSGATWMLLSTSIAALIALRRSHSVVA